jgi:chromosome segregation ATPase
MKMLKKLIIAATLSTAILTELNAGSGATAGVLGGIGGFALGTAIANRPRREYREVEYVQAQPQVQYIQQPAYQDSGESARLRKKLREKDDELDELKGDLNDLRREMRQLKKDLDFKQQEISSVAAEGREARRTAVEASLKK